MSENFAPYRPDRVIMSSVLDRLGDLEPERSLDQAACLQTQTQQLREAIRRDLEALLNTRRPPESVPLKLTELASSAFSYGVDGFISANLVTDEDKEYFARALEQSIAHNEARLLSVNVIILSHVNPERVLKLRIEAIVRVLGNKSPIHFQTRIDPSSQRFSIEAVNE